jgi:AcrR family transcriptional regulator
LAVRRAERKAQSRAKLLTAARKVFAEKGLGEATARDIVRETDLATGTFYNHFRDKEHAFRAVLEELAVKGRATLHEARTREGVPLERRMEDGYRAYFETVVEERELFRVMRRNAGVIATMSGEGLFEAGVADVLADLESWQAAGEIDVADLDYLAAAIVGIGFQVAIRLVEREPPDPAAAARFCTRIVLGGAPRPAPARKPRAGTKRKRAS